MEKPLGGTLCFLQQFILAVGYCQLMVVGGCIEGAQRQNNYKGIIDDSMQQLQMGLWSLVVCGNYSLKI